MTDNYTLIEVEEVDCEKYMPLVFDAKPVRDAINVCGEFGYIKQIAEENHFYCNTSVLIKNDRGDVVGVLDRSDNFIQMASPINLNEYEAIFEAVKQ